MRKPQPPPEVEEPAEGLISCRSRVAVDVDLAQAALNSATQRLATEAGLTVDLARDFDMQIEASITVPVDMDFADIGDHRSFTVTIRARSQVGGYPIFRGKLSLSKRAGASELELRGQYRPPFGWLGYFGDATFMRDVAASSLQRFLDELATDILHQTRITGTSISTHVGAVAERTQK